MEHRAKMGQIVKNIFETTDEKRKFLSLFGIHICCGTYLWHV